MNKRKLGELEVSALGFGCMGLSHAYGVATPKNEAHQQIRAAVEQGYTLFDTAELYTGKYADGSIAINEEVVGEALKPIRDQVIIATKCGIHFNDNQLVTDSSPETIRKSIDGSLKRMGLDVIDLYYQHMPDPNVAPEVVAEVMAELIKAGKIRYWGISNASADYIRKADATCKVTAVQDRYSMIARDSESLFPMLEELNIGLVAYSPLGNGMLTSGARYTSNHYDRQLDFRSFLPQYTEEGIKTGQHVIDLVAALANEKNATTAQISLSWMLSKKPWIVPIPGTSKHERMVENAGASEVYLSAIEVEELDRRLSEMDLDILKVKLGKE